jgi:hypothetical protein
VTSLAAYGLGIYCVFTKAPIVAANAIEAPNGEGVKLENMICVRFGRKPNSIIAHTLNDRGDGVLKEFSTRLNK